MNPVQKRPGYLVAKDFKITNVLGNLQGYKIATGQIGKEEVEDISRQHGGDEGAIFGSLITKAGDIQKRAGRKRASDDNQERKRRKRRRRKQKKRDNDEEIEPVQNKNADLTIIGDNGEPLAIPSSILEYGLSDSESEHDDNVSQNNKTSSTSSSCSEEEEEGSSNFFGLNDEEDPLIIKTEAQPSGVEESAANDSRQHGFDSSQPYPEVRTDIDEWDPSKNKYKEKTNTLSTYKCWKCKRIGHLPEDCTVHTGSSPGFGPSSASRIKHASIYQGEGDDSGTDSTLLKHLFKRCHILRNSKDSRCSTCGGRSNLVCCMDCGLIVCDGRGHLTDHLISYPSHNKLYSFKLRRLIKCCKPTCSVADGTKLLMCSTCLSKQFNSHYNMINATWSRSGLKGIPNTLACEEHFQWHRINCANAMEEPLLSRGKLQDASQKHDGLLSEFYF